MKSLNFTMLRDKLESQEKTQTIRCLFIPSFEIGETIQIKFKKNDMYQAIITDLYPKQLKDITKEEAIRDGFKTKRECIKTLQELNNINSKNRWCFIIRFNPINQITNYFNKCTNNVITK